MMRLQSSAAPMKLMWSTITRGKSRYSPTPARAAENRHQISGFAPTYLNSGNQSEQEVPIAPDPGTDDTGQITEVRKDPIGCGRFEAKLDFFGYR
jgi:hypothetical protein